jgi:hypothetical protein
MDARSGWKRRGLVVALGLAAGACTQQPVEGGMPRPVSPRPLRAEVDVAPRITSTFQSELQVVAGSPVLFRVVASDPQARALTISWGANTGTLGEPAEEAAQSEVEWRPPPCVLTGTTPSITATVTSALGLSASTTFTLTGATTCLAGNEPPSSGPRLLSLQSESVAWGSR